MQTLVEQTVVGMGFELVELERSAGGTLRVTIDHPWVEGQAERFIQVEDCERVTRQLQYVLDVEGLDYKRLEVSSPGIDRPLRNESDFKRFSGQVIDIVLKQAIGADGAGVVSGNRKKFRGLLEATDGVGEWQIQWRDEPQSKPGQRPSAKRNKAPVQVLRFVRDELREARLAPIVNFKGRTPNKDASKEVHHES